MSPARVIAAVAAAGTAAFALRRRRRLPMERLVLLVLAALGLAVYASGLLSGLPDPKRAIERLAEVLGPWTYVLVGAMAFLETGAFVGLVAPGETVVVVGGVVAAHGRIELLPLIGLVWSCAVLGDSTSFFIGRRLGRGFLLRHGRRLGITRERLDQVERYFARHGGKTILIGRFIGLVRALAPFIAGSSRMRYGAFIPYSALGTGLWAALFSLVGFLFWRSFDRVVEVAGRASTALAVLVAAAVAGVYGYRRLRDPDERRRVARWLERQARRPALRPVAAAIRAAWRRVVAPAWSSAAPRLRLLWQRLTPGELGLELTVALAVAAAGLYVFVLYTAALAADPGRTPLDSELLRLADGIRPELAADAARVLTRLGAFPAVAAAVGTACVVLAAAGRRIDAVFLAAGLATVLLAVQLSKAGIDRPRPAGALIGTRDSSFPSGHAAYSTAWVAVAVSLSRALPRPAGRTAIISGALVLAAAVGLSRVYLHAHYWSDVAGGWGLGFGVFALYAAGAMVVAHIRHNGERPLRGSASARAARR